MSTVKSICTIQGLHDRSNKSLLVFRSTTRTGVPVLVYPADADKNEARKSYIRETSTKYDDARVMSLKSYEAKFGGR